MGSQPVAVPAGGTGRTGFTSITAQTCRITLAVFYDTARSLIAPSEKPALEQAFSFGLTNPLGGGNPVPQQNQFLLIVGHADQTGGDSVNQPLSERRARAALAVFTEDANIWEQLYQTEGWGATELGVMSAEVDVGGDSTLISRYQSDASARFDLMQRYLVYLRPSWLLGQSPPIQPATVSITGSTEPILGCSSSRPRVNAPGTSLRENRRAEFFYFAQANPGVTQCPSSSAYGSWQTTCGRPPLTVQVELINDCGNPHSGNFDLTLPNGGRLYGERTDSQGLWQRGNLPEGSYTVTAKGQSRTFTVSSSSPVIQMRVWPSISVSGSNIQRDKDDFLRFFGTNAYYLMKETVLHPGPFPNDVADFFSMAEQAGINVVRTWGYWELGNAQQATQLPPIPSSGRLQLRPGPGLDALERVIDEAERRGIWLIITLCDFWRWEGGIRQYVSWANNSFLPLPPPINEDPGPGVAEAFYTGRFLGRPLSYDPRQLYRDYVCHVMTRFCSKPNILAWEMINEPRGSEAILLTWIKEQAQYIRDNCDPRDCSPPKLLSVGGIEHKQLATIFDALPPHLIDLVDTHLYPHSQGLDATEANQAVHDAVEYAVKKLQLLYKPKPFYLGEFGIPSNAGRDRHQEYQNWSNTLWNKGASGLFFWQLLPPVRTAHDENEIHVEVGGAPPSPPPLRGVLGSFSADLLKRLGKKEPLLSEVNQVVGVVNNARMQWPNC